MANIRQVALQAKVSIATVSRVLNGHETVAPDLRQRVMNAVDTCDYVPNAVGRSKDLVALVYAGTSTTSAPYDSACIAGLIDAVAQVPFDLVILNHQRDRMDSESFQQFFRRKGIGGIILRSTAEHRSLVSSIAEEKIPVVVLGDHFEYSALPFVYSDSTNASEEAVDYLCSLGHTRIAFATSDHDDGDHVDRFNAYRRVLKKNGLYDESLVYRTPPYRFDGAQLMRSMLGVRNRPTAVFIADPLVAVGAINEAHSMGVKIPEDFSIIGVDDTDTRNTVYPKMTAVCQNSEMLGRAAIDHLQVLLQGDATDVPLLQPSQAWLEINSTAGPPPEIASRVLPNGIRLSSC